MQVEVNEIAGWDELDVSWAVLGFAGTGTTSLVMNLHGHPELELIYEPDQRFVLEEHFFMYGRIAHLPSRRQVLDFNAQQTKKPGERRLRGVKRTSYMWSPAALSRFALIPRLKAIVVIRDPVDMAERQYLHTVGSCLDLDTTYRFPQFDECVGRICVMSCIAHSARGLDVHDFRLGAENFTLSVPLRATVVALGRNRLLVVDTEELKYGDCAFYNSVAGFIGVKAPFPANSTFGRAHERQDTGAQLSTAAVRRMVLASPGGAKGIAAGRAALWHALVPERQALRTLLGAFPSLRPSGILPKWVYDTQPRPSNTATES